MTERPDIAQITEATSESAKESILRMARDFAPLIDLDFDRDVLPALKNNTFWDVDYMKDNKWGLSVMDAYRCLADTHRTLQIMGGINETVSDLRAKGKTHITAIDAGTGTGVFSIYLASLGVDQVYALELNENTANMAEKFIGMYGFSDKVRVIRGDATAMKIPELPANPADILISENLSGGLFAEPQFQIISHLSRFLKKDAPILPFKADVSVSLGHGEWNKVDWGGKPERIVLASRRIPNLNAVTAQRQYAHVESRVGMRVPRLVGDLSLGAIDGAMANTLLVSTIFQINESGHIYTLESDSAEFLGKTIAIRLPSEAHAKNNRFNISLNYSAGFSVRTNEKSISVNGSDVSLLE